MDRKVIKFRSDLADLILAGKKTSTWRLFDDKDLTEGDAVSFVRWESGEPFANARLTSVREKTLGSLTPSDYEGHEQYRSDEEMYATYRTYYGDRVGPETVLKLIDFELI